MKFYQVDAFAENAFEGNPAAVLITEKPLDDQLMQNIAMEMNLSETAFLVPRKEGYGLRWFTPAAEVALCGHATLASAHVLFETGTVIDDQKVSFHTLSGELQAWRRDNNIMMDFPAEPAHKAEAPAGLMASLGLETGEVFKNRFDYMVVVKDQSIVALLDPDQTRLAGIDCRGVIVTAPGAGQYDFVSRFFAPAVGVPEDPVTGSAHCCLGPFWQSKTGKDILRGRQISRRGGTVLVEVIGDRVHLGGTAVTTVEGELKI